MPEALKFQKWVFEEVLPTLRRTGSYNMGAFLNLEKKYSEVHNQLMTSNQTLIEVSRKLEVAYCSAETARQDAVEARKDIETARKDAVDARKDSERARRDLVTLCSRFAHIDEDVVSKPKQGALLHTLTIHRLTDENGTCAVVFTRCQKRSLSRQINNILTKDPGAVEIYRARYVPNSTNTVNCVKDTLRARKRKFQVQNNVLKFSTKDTSADEIIEIVSKYIDRSKIK